MQTYLRYQQVRDVRREVASVELQLQFCFDILLLAALL